MSDSRTDPVDEHVVFFTTALAEPAAERYPSLRAAVSRVESLCNDHDVRDAMVFQLVPVPLNVRSYYRVEIDAESSGRLELVRDRPEQVEQVVGADGAADPESVQRSAESVAPGDELPEPHADQAAGDRAESLDAHDLRLLRERRPMREMREEVAPQPRSGETARAVLAEVPAAPQQPTVDTVAAAAEERERGRSLGFFIR